MSYIYEAILWMLVGVLWWYFYWPHRWYWVDKTRYHLFVIRDGLFNEAISSSVIRFDDEAYGIARTTINGMLRTLEDWSFWRILLIVRRYARDSAGRENYKRYREETARAVNKLHPKGRELVEETIRRAEDVLLIHIIRISLPLCMIFLVFRVIKRAKELKPPPSLKKYCHAVDFESNIAGDDDLWSYLNSSKATS